MKLREALAERLFGRLIEARVQAAVEAVDDAWWREANAPAGREERPWHLRRQELDAALAAWREHPLARRIVSLTTDYVLGDGVTVSSDLPAVDRWLRRFWNHPQNRLSARLPDWCDELTRAGELFIVLSRNPADGISYVRALPASRVDRIETDADDLERELRYHEQTGDDLLAGRWWTAAAAAGADEDQVMLHFAINRPPGCLRGEGDLTAILPWLEHYAGWLEDRVRVNRLKSAFVWQVTLRGATPAQVAAKRAQYGRPPRPGSVIITNEGETWEAIVLGLDRAGDQTPPRNRLLPLLAVLAMTMETLGLAALISSEIEGGTLRALLVTPLRVSGLFLAKSVMGVGFTFVQVVFLLAVTGGLSRQPLIMLTVALLGSILVTGIGFLLAVAGRDMQSVMGWGVLAIILLGVPGFGVLVPGSVTAWAKVIPSYYMVDAVYQVTNLEADWSGVAGDLLALAAFAAGFLALGVLILRRKVR